MWVLECSGSVVWGCVVFGPWGWSLCPLDSLRMQEPHSSVPRIHPLWFTPCPWAHFQKSLMCHILLEVWPPECDMTSFTSDSLGVCMLALVSLNSVVILPDFLFILLVFLIFFFLLVLGIFLGPDYLNWKPSSFIFSISCFLDNAFLRILFWPPSLIGVICYCVHLFLNRCHLNLTWVC